LGALPYGRPAGGREFTSDWLPCYDFTPVMNHKVVSALPKVKVPTSFATHSHGVTGGVYKARERIHRDILIHDY